MPSLNISSYVIAGLLVAVAALGIWLMVDRSLLTAAQEQVVAKQAEVDAAIAVNHTLKTASDECDAKVDALKKDGDAWKARADAAAKTAQPFFALGSQAEKAIVANPPANSCAPILKYWREQSQAFKW